MKPTVGRIVHFHQEVYGTGVAKEPLAAIVVKVFSPECVNLLVFSDGMLGGNTYPVERNLNSVAHKDAAPDGSSYWNWPPRSEE